MHNVIVMHVHTNAKVDVEDVAAHRIRHRHLRVPKDNAMAITPWYQKGNSSTRLLCFGGRWGEGRLLMSWEDHSTLRIRLQAESYYPFLSLNCQYPGSGRKIPIWHGSGAYPSGFIPEG